MERNKWEDEFRQKLDQREIAPTPHAWERLDAMLNAAESRKPVRRINWLYAAAAVLGFMMLATVAFRDWKNERHEVVSHGHPSVEKRETPGLPVMTGPVKPQSEIAEERISPAPEDTVLPHRQPVGQPKTERTMSPEAPQPHQQVAENQSVKEENKPNIQPIREIPVTPEADVQLADAGQTSSKPVKVDPRALLSQVDGELDQSFREKVLSGVSKRYQDVKVALANRNRE